MSASIDSSHFPKCGAKIKILLYNANIFYLFFANMSLFSKFSY